LVTNSNPLGVDPNDPAGKDDIVTTGELHVPIDRPVIAELSSKDVIHDYFVPDMRIAGDAIPGSLIPIWFTPVKTGSYEVVCAQLCGLGHYGMKGTLVVDTPQDYQAWLKERAELAGSGAQAAAPSASPGAPQQPNTPPPAAASASPSPGG
jgi:cytochrome c oxidase subunit 2